jgi:hypothetical protein
MNKYAKYSIALLASASLIIGISAFTGSKTETNVAGKYVVVDIYELPGYEDKGVHIHYGGGKTEFIPFPNDMKDHHLDDNGNIIVNALNKLDDEGYEVISTSGGLGDRSGMITKVFLKKKI